MATRARSALPRPSPQRAKAPRRSHELPVLTPIALALMVALPMRSQAQQIARPVVPLPNTVPVPAAAWRVQGSGAAWTTPVANTRGGADAVVNQDSQRAIYQWQSFDVGAQSSMTFNLPTQGAALNRVVGSTAPSQIFGQLRSTVPGANGARVAGGELLLINQNGILFGPTAQVNTGSLIASTLNVVDGDFLSAYANSINGAIASFRYEGDPLLFTNEANFVRLDTGAEITTASGGRVFLFAKNVHNAGQITTPGGQTVLAGGSEVYLNDPSNEKLYASEVNKDIPALRGLLVEVGGADGTVINSGSIEVPRGNATLVGMAVNQQGRISATTSVSENGSVMLLARGGAGRGTDGSNDTLKRATVSGALTLGEGSRIDITPDTTLDAAGQTPTSDNNTTFTTSRVELAGQTVSLERNAVVRAPGAIVNVRAEDVPDYTPNLIASNAYSARSDTARILVGDGARIDVAGTSTAQVSVARNFVTTELLGANDLKDAPLQRNGPLYRSRVTFDLRAPVPILGDTSAYARGLKRSIDERLADGGKVSLLSTGAVVTHQNSSIDVSGGRVTYTAAEVTPSTLIASDGTRYTLNNAPKDVVYSSIEGSASNRQDRWGVVTQWTPTRTRIEQGYVEGRHAGSVNVLARDVVLDGSMTAATQAGSRQAAGTDARAVAAALEIGRRTSGDFAFGSSGFGTAGLDDLQITATRETLGTDFWANAVAAALPESGRISADTLNRAGFGTVRITADGSVEQQSGAALNLAPQTALELRASGERGIALNADVRSVGGSVLAQTADASSGVLSDAITVAAGVTLDVAGNWVNRRLDGAQAAAAVAGGSVQLLSAHGLDLADGSVIDVSGGATVSTSGTVSGTAAGRIAIESNRAVVSDDQAVATMHVGAELRGYGITQGGTLRLRAPEVEIVSTNGVSNHGGPLIGSTGGTGGLSLAADLFTAGGFISFDIDGGGSVDIVDGVRIAPRAQQWVADANARNVASGTRPGAALQRSVLPDAQRRAVNVSIVAGGLALNRSEATGTLSLGPGSSIDADAGARVSLSANAQLLIDGTVRAAGGQVTLGMGGRGTADGTQSITGYAGRFEVGAQAVVDVSGTVLIDPAVSGLRQGRVVDGGSIALNVSGDPSQARQTRIEFAEGAVLRADGVRDSLDLSTLTATGPVLRRESVLTAAGNINVNAQEGGARLAGTMQARAADANSVGGSLTVALPPSVRALANGGVDDYRIEVSPGALSTAAPARGTIAVSAQSIADGGFADVTLSSPQTVHFAGSTVLQAQRSLTVLAPVLSAADAASVILRAPTSIRLGSAAVDPGALPPAAVATSGTAAVQVESGLVTLAGDQTTEGIGSIDLRAGHRAQLEGAVLNGTTLQASALHTQADVMIDAPQTVTATQALYTIDAAGRQVTFTGGVADSAAPLSAGGSLTVNAARIVQDGVVRAPQGRITLNATEAVTLTERSVTSVSGAGSVVPFGSTLAGTELSYLDQAVTGLTDKSIQLLAPGQEVEIRVGALLDMSGGGELVAHEFVPGPGGSTDIFAGAAGGAFAVIPAVRDFAPADAAIAALRDASGATANIPTGRTITFGAGGPLPAGTYAVLPARYALLPGAYLVTPAGSGHVASGYSQVRPDGATLVGANLGSTGTAVAGPSTGYIVRTSAQARQFSEMRNTNVDTYLAAVANQAGTAVPRLAQDAGSLDIAARQLTLAGTNRFNLPTTQIAGQAARGGGVAIAAERIEVNETVGSDAATLYLTPEQLNATGANSITLGALRGGTGAQGRLLSVTAREVRLDNETDALRADDIVLAATEQVQLLPGAQVIARSASTTSTGNDNGTADTLLVQGDGALLRVSDDTQARTVRTDTSRTTGALDIGAGSVVRGNSITAEATARTTIDATAQLDARVYTLGASRIAVGEVAPGSVSPDTLVLSAALAQRLGRAEQATLRSFDSIDFHGNTTLGSEAQRALVLDAGTLRLTGGAVQANVVAGEVRITNSSGAVSTAEAGTGRLSVTATGLAGGSGDLTVGPGNLATAGTASTDLNARRSVVLDGSTALSAAGDLDVNAVSLTATQVADASLSASGRLRVNPSNQANAAATGARSGAGASVALNANQIVQGSRIDLASGRLALTATGAALPAGTAAIDFATNSRTDLAGRAYVFDGQPVATSGGALTATAQAGDITLATSSRVDVSAGGAGARAGEVTLAATSGSVVVDGALAGTSAAGAQLGGTIEIDSATATDLSRLGAALAAQNTATLENFSASLSVRNRTGDQRVAAGTTLAADQIVIASDAGALNVAGTLDASGAQGGQIKLAAGTGVTFESGAQLLANAEQADKAGGQVQVMSSTGRIALNSGATIDTSGQGSGTDGKLVLRAQRLGTAGAPVTTAEAGSDVAIDPIAATLNGVQRVEAEAVKTYTATTVNAALIGTINTNNAVFAGAGGAQAQAIAARLSAGNASIAPGSVQVRSGVEVQSAGNLTVTGDAAALGWNLTPFDAAGNVARDGAAPMNLTLRAGGNLLVQASISDGFRAGGTTAPTTAAAAQRIVPEATIVSEGGTLRLIGGADTGAANVLATRASQTAGDVVIGGSPTTDVVVRTTTGNIDIAAGRDVRLTSRQAVVYSTGMPIDAATQPGYVAPTINGALIRSGSTRQAALLRGSGSIKVDAGRDVLGATNGATQYGTDWWWRYANGGDASWWTRYDKFRQGFGSFGGGDVAVQAGRDAVQVQAAAAGGGYFARSPSTGNVELHDGDGGSVSLRSGQDVVSGFLFVRGDRVDVTAGRSVAEDSSGNSLQLLHGNTDVRASAAHDLTVGRVSDAHLLGVVSQWAGSNATFDQRFGGIAADASVALSSDAAVVVYASRRPSVVANARLPNDNLSRVIPSAATFTAPEGSAVVGRDGAVFQAPATASSLLVAARNDITLGGIVVGGANPGMDTASVLSINQRGEISSDPFSPGSRPIQTGNVQPVRVVSAKGGITLTDAVSVATPLRMIAADNIRQPGGVAGVNMQHLADTDLSLISAGGKIQLTADTVPGGTSWTAHGPGDLIVLAGGDIDLRASGGIGAVGNRQNTALPGQSARLTVMSGVSLANGDYSNARLRYFHLLGGAGVEGFAGDLVAQLDALQTGTALPTPGSAAARAFDALGADAQLDRARSLVGDAAYDASLLAWMRGRSNDAGLTLATARSRVDALDDNATAALAARVIGDRWMQQVPAAQQQATALALATADGGAYAADLAAFVTARTGSRPVDTADALARFDTLPIEQQLLHMNRVLASELRAAGRTASALSGTERDAAYAPAYQALATVFPNAATEGDLRMGASQVKTLQGSGIELLTPRGGINVGQLTASSNNKSSSELGIVTTAGGGVAMTVRDSVEVNQSRVFTVGQGDLQIWASEGNIDAGRGAKTVTGAPPPVYRLVEGRIVVDTSGSYAGSGIAVLDASSTLDLYAPKGEINAGDAGIKSAGNAFFGATRFVGADNLQVGGVVVGAPPAPPAAGGTAGLAAASQSATAAGNATTSQEDEDERRKRRARRNLLLDFLGFGGERP